MAFSNKSGKFFAFCVLPGRLYRVHGTTSFEIAQHDFLLWEGLSNDNAHLLVRLFVGWSIGNTLVIFMKIHLF